MDTTCTFHQRLLGGTPILNHFFFRSEALASFLYGLPIRNQPKPKSKP